jgi:hypothetical protein
VQGQFRHQFEKGIQEVIRGFSVMSVRPEAVDEDDLILYALLNMRHVLSGLFKLLTTGWHQRPLGFSSRRN